MIDHDQLAAWMHDARQRTGELVADLSDSQLIGAPLATVNPLLWEIGHVAWFQEKWVLRHAAQRPPIDPEADALYDSAAVAHDTRWDLRLPNRQQTLHYITEVHDRVLERLAEPDLRPEDVYFTLLSVFHEDMHTEAFTYTRQTLGYAAPRFSSSEQAPQGPGDSRPKAVSTSVELAAGESLASTDAQFPGGTWELGATPAEPFVFDNEKWAHEVQVRPFAMARVPVTQAQFAEFVEDGGYLQSRFWSAQGWQWRQEASADGPAYWQRAAGRHWLRRDFDRWVPLEARRPMIHVNWYEADAYCRWAGRRLPRESEWEYAASGYPASRTGDLSPLASAHRGVSPSKCRYPWGAAFPTAKHAQLDWRTMGCADVDQLREGDNAQGCRQMIGNIWEWTADNFLPYPGFVADPYQEYSAPWFGSHKVLRGGSWATRSRLIRNTWRNFYRPDRRDVWAGFRTCAMEP